jgi:hypothetical protein
MWRNIVFVILGLTLPSGSAVGEERSLSDQLIGTWKIVSVDNARPDGSIKQIFGPHPKGIAVFDARGNTAIILMRPS